MGKARLGVGAEVTVQLTPSIGLALELRESRICHIVQAQQRVGKVLDGIAFIEFGTEGGGMVEIAVEASETELVATIFQAYTIEGNAIVGVVGEIHARGTEMESEFFPHGPKVYRESRLGESELFGTHVDHIHAHRDTDAVDIKCHIGVCSGRERGIVMQVGIVPR